MITYAPTRLGHDHRQNQQKSHGLGKMKRYANLVFLQLKHHFEHWNFLII